MYSTCMTYCDDLTQVCGTDGVTYDNVCVLRSTGANTRVDYQGPCISRDDDETVQAVCERVREEGRCTFNPDNCGFLVEVEDGCCPICGVFQILL